MLCCIYCVCHIVLIAIHVYVLLWQGRTVLADCLESKLLIKSNQISLAMALVTPVGTMQNLAGQAKSWHS